jgi:hypothetical protein
MTPEALNIVLAQFNALRGEILWINGAKFALIQAKYVWTASILGGLSFLKWSVGTGKNQEKDRISLKAVFLILNFLLLSLLAYDLVFDWLDNQVITIGAYIREVIEPPLTNQHLSGLSIQLWEHYLKSKQIGGFPFFGIGVKSTTLLPAAGVLAYLVYLLKAKKVRLPGECLDVLGLFNVILFIIIISAIIYVAFGITHG